MGIPSQVLFSSSAITVFCKIVFTCLSLAPFFVVTNLRLSSFLSHTIGCDESGNWQCFTRCVGAGLGCKTNSGYRYGSGLLALMLEQRTEMCLLMLWSWILRLQCRSRKTSLSPWLHRITVHTDDIQRWAPCQTVRFDLIVSNPPYYEPGMECVTPQRDHRHYWLLRRIVLRETVFFVCGIAGANR